MKRKLKMGMGILILSLGVITFGCKSSSQKGKSNTNAVMKQTVYTCPMHPEVQQSEPGTCPTCGMKLEKKGATMHHSDMQMNEVVYTCPMHPKIEKHEPGSCPECGMDLVKKKTNAEHSHDGHSHE